MKKSAAISGLLRTAAITIWRILWGKKVGTLWIAVSDPGENSDHVEVGFCIRCNDFDRLKLLEGLGLAVDAIASTIDRGDSAPEREKMH